MDSKEFRNLICAIIENKNNEAAYGPLLAELIEELKRRNAEVAAYVREAQKLNCELKAELYQLSALPSWDDTPFTRSVRLYNWKSLVEYCEKAFEHFGVARTAIKHFDEQIEFGAALEDSFLRGVDDENKD